MPAPEKNFDTADPLPSEEYVEKAMPSILGSFDMTVVYVMIIFFIQMPRPPSQGGPLLLPTGFSAQSLFLYHVLSLRPSSV